MANRTSGILDRLERIEAKLDNLLNEELMTVRDAARYLNISVSYLYKLTCTRKIPHYKPYGKRVYFKRSELTEWAFSHKIYTDEELQTQADTWLATRRRRLTGIRQSRNMGKE